MQVEQLKAKLDDLESAMVDHETTVEALRAELSKKNEQLGFITDEKVKQFVRSTLFCDHLHHAY